MLTNKEIKLLFWSLKAKYVCGYNGTSSIYITVGGYELWYNLDDDRVSSIYLGDKRFDADRDLFCAILCDAAIEHVEQETVYRGVIQTFCGKAV